MTSRATPSTGNRVSLVVLLVLLGGLGAVLWSRWSAGRLATEEARLDGPYRTEEQWIAAEIVQDVVEMASFTGRPNPDPDRLEFSIEGPALAQAEPRAEVTFALEGKGRMSRTISWPHHIWSPADYEPLAVDVLRALGRAGASAPGDDETTLAALLSPRARVIETQNQRVSQKLAVSMLDPEAHEEAALIVGTLALREAAGYFQDVRQLLCRMTAHLALAGALRGTPERSVSGRYAEVILSMLAGRTAEAMAALDGLQAVAVSPARQAWSRALRLWITYDWRELPNPWERSLLEKVEYFRAIGGALGGAAASAFHDGLDEDAELPDWGRHALQGVFGVREGGFAFSGIEPEIVEARDVWTRMNTGTLADADLAGALNQSAERCITSNGPRVLSWGTWAASVQRHIGHRVVTTDTYIRKVLARPDEAEAKAAELDRRLRGLTLYPFAQGMRWYNTVVDPARLAEDLNSAVETAARRPELVNPVVWGGVAHVTRYEPVRRRMPSLRSWFADPVPWGTAHDANRRLDVDDLTRKHGEHLAGLRRLDPWAYWVADKFIKETHGPRPTVEQIRQAHGMKAEYTIGLLDEMSLVAGHLSPEGARFIEQQCRLVADRCVALAINFVAAGRDDDAARALARAWEAGHDSVLTASYSLFLVRYHHERGRAADATRVAEQAEATGSAQGMVCMGYLLEWRGKLAEAEEYFVRTARTYENQDRLLGFYRRRVDQKHPGYEAKLARMLGEKFPDGLEKLDAAVLPAPPRDGARIKGTAAMAEGWGLAKHDVIVGLDGWRVRNEGQYHAVAQFDYRPEMRIRLWRKDRYLDVTVRALGRSLDLEYETFPVQP